MKRIEKLIVTVLILPMLYFLHSGTVVLAQAGLVGYWSFDDPLGDNYTEVENEDDKLVLAGAEQIAGVFGQALYFDGGNSYATIENAEGNPPEILSKLGKGTISFWFRVDYIPRENGIAPMFYYGQSEPCSFFDAANKGLIIEVGHSPVHYQSERLYFTAWKNGCTFPSFCYDSRYSIPTEQWHHLAVVVGEEYNTGYLNGEEMKDRRYNFGNATYSQFFEDALAHEKLWLGRGYWDEEVQYFEGAMDELRIYNRPLTPSEVKNLYEVNSLVSAEMHYNNAPGIMISPNPSTGAFSYRVDHTYILPGILEITDLKGNSVFKKRIQDSRGTVVLDALAGGIYTVVIHGESGSLKQRIAVVR